jgi:hypothetical protein
VTFRSHEATHVAAQRHRAAGNELPPNGSVNHPPVPAARPLVDLLRRLRRPYEHTYGGGWALRHDGWRHTSAVPAEQRRLVLCAAYFTGSIESAHAIRRVQSAGSTVHRVPYGRDSHSLRGGRSGNQIPIRANCPHSFRPALWPTQPPTQ